MSDAKLPQPQKCDCGYRSQGHVGEHLVGCPARASKPKDFGDMCQDFLKAVDEKWKVQKSVAESKKVNYSLHGNADNVRGAIEQLRTRTSNPPETQDKASAKEIFDLEKYEKIKEKLEIIRRYHWGDGSVTREQLIEALGKGEDE